MKKILYILLIFQVKIVFSQAPSKLWDKTIGGNKIDGVSSMVSTADGGYVIAGSTYSDISGDKSEANRGSALNYGRSDYWIVKIDNTGQKVWDKTIGGGSDDFAKSIVSTTDGGFVIAGYSQSGISGDKTQANIGGVNDVDFWIVKINSLGQIQWDKTYGGTRTDYAFSIVNTNDGGFVIAGTTESGDGFYNNYWVIKLNGSGIMVWDKIIQTDANDEARTVVATSDGGFVVGGFTSSGISYDKTEPNKGFLDFWIVKLNNAGQKVWDKTIGGTTSDDRVNSIISTSDGGFLVTGYSQFGGIGGDKSEISRGGADYWIVKLDNNGQKIWDKTLGGSDTEIPNSVIATSDGGYIILGSSASNISGDKTEVNHGGGTYIDFDNWLVKLNSAGQKVWDKTFGGSLSDNGDALLLALDNSIIIGGSSKSQISGNKSEDSKGDTDFWILKVGEQIFETIATGDWNANTTWNTNTPPTATKTAKINSTHTVSIPNAGNNVKTIQMNGGILNLNGGTLEIKNQ